MSTCIHCGRDTGDTNHQLITIIFANGSDFKEKWENRSEQWKCLATGNDYLGRLSEEATSEAQKDYYYRSNIFVLDLLLLLDPENAQYRKERGKTYLKMGKYKQAIDDFTGALEFSPNDGEIYYLRSEAFKNFGKPDLAKRDLETASRKGYNPSMEKE
ncbi:MAG: tetratricopeptide repeat protein [Candidatus Glassbacteria bacterium]